jgi:hypothetical protein
MKTDYEMERKQILMAYIAKRLTHCKLNFKELVQNLNKVNVEDKETNEAIRAELNMLAI